MKAFADLYAALDASTSTQARVEAMSRYFAAAPPADAAWAAYLLAGGRPRQPVPTRTLREAARQAAGLPEWLFEECYQAVGDLAETIAHLLPPPAAADARGLADWVTETVLPLRAMDEASRMRVLAAAWDRLGWQERFLFNKLITGGLRVGVSRALVVRALARAAGIDARRVAQRMVGYTDRNRLPDAARYLALVAAERADGDAAGGHESQAMPYPFFLAQPLHEPPQALGPVADWLVEWKWDGIRAQLVRRADAAWLWSRGEDLVSEQFPELVEAGQALAAGTVLDGEILAWQTGAEVPMPFAALQRRIGLRRPGPQTRTRTPVVFLAYDLLEAGGQDLRASPLAERRAHLERLIDALDAAARARLRASPLLGPAEWNAAGALRDRARALGVEGLMLKRAGSPYGIGRTRSAAQGDWWKWKVDPLSVDAVLVYAQRGHGRRAGLYTDYTFAVWDRGRDRDGHRDGHRDHEPQGEPRLVPFAKAYSGLTDAEIREVDAVIRRTTRERFGPVRSVEPTLVFEIAFEAIQASTRHKSGLAVRFPRMLRLRRDKRVEDADSLESLRALIDAGPRAG